MVSKVAQLVLIRMSNSLMIFCVVSFSILYNCKWSFLYPRAYHTVCSQNTLRILKFKFRDHPWLLLSADTLLHKRHTRAYDDKKDLFKVNSGLLILLALFPHQLNLSMWDFINLAIFIKTKKVLFRYKIEITTT